MDEKQRVISVLRALLLNCKNDGMPLRVLKQDYSFHEGKQEIPLFEHKSVVDFLISSGEFILNIDHNGLVTVRGKPKLLHQKGLVTESKSFITDSSCFNVLDSTNDVVIEKIKMEPPSCNATVMTEQKSSTDLKSRSATVSNIDSSSLVTDREKPKLLHKKSLVTESKSFITDSYCNGTVKTEQKSSTDLASCSSGKLNLKTNSKTLPEHLSKPSIVFTFEQLNGDAQKETLKKLFDQNSNLMENSGDQALCINTTHNDKQRLQAVFSEDELQKDEDEALQVNITFHN